MPGDVAMDEPCTGVVRFEGNRDEAVAGEEDHVSARWVVELGVEKRRMERLGGLLKKGEIVTVEVNLEGA